MMPPEDPFQQEGNMLSGNNKNKTMLAPPLPPKPKTRVEMGLVYDDPDQAPNNTTNYSCDTESSSHRSSILGCSIQPVTLKFQHVSYKIKLKRNSEWWWSCSCGGGSNNGKEKKILNDITGVVCPGEILAMLGPSGSGKTTLLTALGGRLGGKISGKILYNAQKMTRAVKRSTGFVTQDDVLYPHLTVMETLTYTAFLRLPSTLSKSEKVEQAEAVLMELGLGRCRNTIIGGPFVRGVSGGERKRVSIGQEMLINPSLLLLDEPTSGLDSTTAQRILLTLQDLARSGRTIITTIHQPSSRLYHMFNKVILLSEGSPIYYGNASSAIDYFSSIGFSPSFLVNPADFMLDLSNGIAAETKLTHLANDQGEARSEYETQKAVRQRLMSAYQSNLACKLNAEIDIIVDGHSNFSSNSTRVADTNQWTTGWFYQFSVLLARGLKERRYESFSGLRIFQALSMSILSGLLWWNSSIARLSDQVGLLFFFSIFWGFFPLFNAIFTYPQERAMLVKERTSGMYRLSSYIMARTVGDLPMELSLPVLFTVITYWMGGLKADAAIFIETLMVVLLNVLVSQGLGLALGAVLMDVKQATTLSSVTMLTFLLAGGYYVQKIPIFISWLKYVSFSYYCYKLLVAVQYTMDETYRCNITKFCRVADFPPIRSIGLDHKGLSVLALTIMLLSYRLIAYAALRKVKLRTK